MKRTLTSKNVLRSLWLFAFVGACFPGCKRKPAVPQAPVQVKPADPAVELEETLAKLPTFVDKDVYKGFWNMARRCNVDVARSALSCNSDYFENIVKICARGLKPRHGVLQTVSFVFETGDDKMKTAAAELLARAYAKNAGTVPNKEITRKLMAQFAALPEAQALDVAPVLTHVVGSVGLEGELYPLIDQPGKQKLASAVYRNIMATARLRVFEKLWDVARSDSLEVSVAAVEAPRALGGRTLEENKQVCDWMKDLTKDTRAVIVTRAHAFLASCGSPYLENVLASDEARLAAGKPLAAGLDVYQSLCGADARNAYGDPTRAQCSRLKKLALAVVKDANAREGERVQALGILAEQFPDKETLALATRFAEGDAASALSRKAHAALQDLGAGSVSQGH